MIWEIVILNFGIIAEGCETKWLALQQRLLMNWGQQNPKTDMKNLGKTSRTFPEQIYQMNMTI